MQRVNEPDYFGSVVKSVRQAKGMTQSQLATILTITTRYLKAIENSGKRPSYNLLVRIVHELDIPTDAVFHATHDKIEFAEKLVPLWKDP